MNIFEQASRDKVRFSIPKGIISTEELWDLKLETLNEIAKAVNSELKRLEEESFIPSESNSKTGDPLRLKLDLIVHVINTKVEEDKQRQKYREVKAAKQRLAELIDKKKTESLENKSLEELEAEYAALN